MRIKKIFLWESLLSLGLLIWVATSVSEGREPSKDKAGKTSSDAVADFRLLDHEGKPHELYRQTQAPVVVLVVVGNGCPIVRQSIAPVKALRDRFAEKKVVFWFINPNSQDDQASIVEEAREFGMDLPVLMDQSQLVARSLNATRTAEAIAINTKDWKIFYRGAIDDRLGYGTQKVKPPKTFLADALENFLAGKKISPRRTLVKGCAITFVSVTPKARPDHP